MTKDDRSEAKTLREIALVFLKLGIIGFGGPAAHIAMMEEEVVVRRRWLTRERFLDLLGTTNLIPGPNSTEMAIHIGYLRAGWAGLVIAGATFILPAVGVTSTLAWLYVRWGSLPQAAPFLSGVKPVVVIIIFGAVWRLGKTAFRGWRRLLIGLLVVSASLLGVDEILALLGGGFLGSAFLHALRREAGPTTARHKSNTILLALVTWSVQPLTQVAAVTTGALGVASVSLWKLGLFFLKVGAVLYGSGYVLVAFLEGGLVQQYGWLSRQQLLDAVAIGQFTPGPVLSTATFIGYLLADWPGAAVATVGIFLPSFLFVAALGPLLLRARRSPLTSSFLDAVNASSVALMAAVVIKLIPETLTSWQALLIALLAGGASIYRPINAAWIVIGGAVLGWLCFA
ncbi:MAG: chromate efflux transporter [Acidobacteria bacterium]|nr:chromate efflux transporter [Acidobacteriota bacterium]